MLTLKVYCQARNNVVHLKLFYYFKGQFLSFFFQAEEALQSLQRTESIPKRDNQPSIDPVLSR